MKPISKYLTAGTPQDAEHINARFAYTVDQAVALIMGERRVVASEEVAEETLRALGASEEWVQTALS